jgi:ethanolamine utilization cobalamin adenosyltransferase
MGIPTLVAVQEELAAQRAKQAALEAQLAYVLVKQNEMSANQDEMASDLKQLLAFFLPKPT